MEPKSAATPLVAIVGQTASGKTALALELARRFNGEIIAADSRTVYRGMDIGTAKPTAGELAVAPHHLMDVVNPDEPFNVHMFQQLANKAIAETAARGHLPLLVGGTGLYIDAVLFGFGFAGQANPELRKELESLSVQELQERLVSRGLSLPQNSRNPRHLVRAIERDGLQPTRQALRTNTVVLGLETDRESLSERVRARVDAMVTQGLVEEVSRLYIQYGGEIRSMQADAYRAFIPYVKGEITLEEAKQTCIRLDLQYAKRQKTWFRRNKSIQWISNTDEAVELLTTKLNK